MFNTDNWGIRFPPLTPCSLYLLMLLRVLMEAHCKFSRVNFPLVISWFCCQIVGIRTDASNYNSDNSVVLQPMEGSLLVGQVHRVLKNIPVYVSARRVWLSGAVTTFALYKCNSLMRPPGGDPEKNVFFHCSFFKWRISNSFCHDEKMHVCLNYVTSAVSWIL